MPDGARGGTQSTYPPLRAYLEAVKDRANVRIPFFRRESMQIFLNRRGSPFMSVGGAGAVFRYQDEEGNQYALKVFTSGAPGRADRYRALHETLQITKFPFMVDFQYVEEGIQVGSRTYPVVVMEWGCGVQLDQAIAQDLEDDGKLDCAAHVAGSLFSAVRMLQDWNMGHGDLQEGNILVTDDNRVVLIDYDGMFVPALAGKDASEIGLADYQHPRRSPTLFARTIDDFSLLSILFQLSVIDREAWKELSGDKRLILTRADYESPEESAVLRRGLRAKQEHVRQMAELLAEACRSDPGHIGAVAKITAAADVMRWLVIGQDVQPVPCYESVIARVVSAGSAGATAAAPRIIAGTPPPAVRVRTGGAGAWARISNLIFEEAEQTVALPAPATAAAPAAPRKGPFLAGLRRRIRDFLYEDV
ncbi:MAG: hypothetical protein HYV63_22680 [Candidatus Schekmanbacteria bacterium]|nr:hypothetical protein [Candidatus Schekmanbacteria bacterium]